MKSIPKHVSIIMDGNGRWALQRGLERLDGHKVGVDSVKECVEFAGEVGIEYLSVFAFSSENWNRPKVEVDGLMELMVDAIVKERESLMENNVRFRVIGDRESLSERVVEKIEELEEETLQNSKVQLIVFLSYSGKWDIVQAVKTILSKGVSEEEIDEEMISAHLATSALPDPDLIIRTSGEQRISNYLLWQSAYSEFYFTEVLWPDFRKNEFEKALKSYQNRERRYGLTSDQLE